MGTLRIMIADDHDLVRRGLKMLLESHPGWKVCAEAHSGREAVAMAEEFRPDIAIMDITMPELNGIEAARKIRKISPNTEMLILSMHQYGSTRPGNHRDRGERLHHKIRF